MTAGRPAAATQIGWDRSDIIGLAALIVSVPSAIAGCIAVAVCLTRRRRKCKTSKTISTLATQTATLFPLYQVLEAYNGLRLALRYLERSGMPEGPLRFGSVHGPS